MQLKIDHIYITKANQITVYIEGKAYTATKEHANYLKIIKAVQKGKSYEKLINLFDTVKVIKDYLAKSGDIELNNGVITYKGKELQNVLTSKILRMLNEGFDILPMLNFLNNLRSNPSKTAQDELMLFMEASDMPITPNGHLIAYKAVRANYYDIHSGKFNNAIGQKPSMPRCDVNDNREITCSDGLHFSSKNYAAGFGSGTDRLMVVKVNPRDVVSIPKDYSNEKARCCLYEVIGEVERVREGIDEYNAKVVCGCECEEEDIYEITCEDCGTDFNIYEEDFTCPSCGAEH